MSAGPALRVRLVRVRVPLRVAHRSAAAAEPARESILVGWTGAEGVEGWGECPTLAGGGYVTESTDAAWVGLATELVPAALAGRMPPPLGLVAASSALADARLDARLRAAGRSLGQELSARTGVPVAATHLPRTAVLAAVGAPEAEWAQRAAAAVEAGAEMVKVKVAPGADVSVVAAVRAAVGDTVPVAADANGAYPDALALAALDDLGLAYLEQPVAATTPWEQMAELRRRLATPVALDESITSADALRSATLAGAVDVVSVKPARLGGAAAAASVLAQAAEAGLGAFVGGMFELGIGRATAAAVASLAGTTWPTDLGPTTAYVERDVCEPVVVDGRGRLVVPEGPGCGRDPDPEALARFTVEDLVLGS